MDRGILWLALFSLAATPVVTSSDPEYDHQTTTYTARFDSSSCSEDVSITPFFSPDHSIDTYVKLIEEAEESIDIFAPGELYLKFCPC